MNFLGKPILYPLIDFVQGDHGKAAEVICPTPRRGLSMLR
jgi:hypothetical protein